jgi:hypothetical protein
MLSIIVNKNLTKNMQQQNKYTNEKAEVYNEIKRQVFFWSGILIAAICISGLFVSSDWIKDTYHSTMSELDNNDSDAGNILTEALSYILDFAIWLKELPIWIKILGAFGGGAIVFFTYKDDSEAK